MVNLKTVSLVASGIAVVLTVTPIPAEACEPSKLLGRVKSVIETEFVVDSATGRTGPARVADRIDVSRDGGTVEMTLYDPDSAEPTLKLTTYLEGGRPVKGSALANGKTVPSMNCAYDQQGRLIEARTGLNTRELGTVETYEYGQGFIRRRAQVFGSWYVTNQTLDTNGRVVKEVERDEAKSTVVRTSEFTYGTDRTEQCSISFMDPRPSRTCVTTIRDSHGNEIEVRSEYQTRKAAFEYDSAGNWVSRRLTITGPRGTTVETIVQRKIEYW